MKEAAKTRLTLRKETIKELTEADLRKVAGALPWTQTCSTYTCSTYDCTLDARCNP